MKTDEQWFVFDADGNQLGPFSSLDADIVVARDEMPSTSARTKDADGRLHVRRSRISKANVCPYFGKEIPEYEQLGLKPNKRYMLYRDPAELEKGAETFNNIQILDEHTPINVAEPEQDKVIGSTGTDAEFEAPYLYNSLVFWVLDGIEDIETNERKELSSAYRYRADMTPGEAPDGTHYDGVMRDIVGNHVALVKEGRAGSDVIVGDSKPKLKELTIMTKAALSRRAATVRGAIFAALRPKLAEDAKLDLTSLFKDIGPKNYVEKKPFILSELMKKLKGQLAQDADISDLAELLDAFDKDDVAEGLDADPETGMPMEEKEDLMTALGGEKKEPAMDEEEERKKKQHEFLAGKLSAEDMAAYDELMGASNSAVPPKKPEGLDEGDKEKDMVTKPAMDAAIEAAVKQTIKTQQAIREAEREVHAYVGELAIACDSAEAVYKAALDALSVDVEGVHPSAYKKILSLQPKRGATDKPVKPKMATDSKSGKTFLDRYPGAASITLS